MDIEAIITNEFPQAGDLIYLNHAAVAPWPRRTCEAVKRFAEENTIQGAKNYPQWVAKENLLREQIATLINAPSPADIALLKNTSEALSLVSNGIHWQAGENIIGTDQEFPSNRIVWEVQQKHGVEYRPVKISGNNEPEHTLISACDNNTRLMAISSVQFGTGLRLDLNKLGRFCRENDILFCVDAIQSLGAFNINVQAVNADFIMADAHKWLLGPEGIALFYCRAELRDQLELQQYGWHMVQESGNYDTVEWQVAESARRFECGSPNMLGIHAFSASLSLLLEIGIEKIERIILKNTSYLFESLKDIKDVEIISPSQERLHSGIVTFKIEGQNHAELHRKLLDKKVICAHRGGGIRFSPHFYISQDKIENGLQLLASII